MRDLNHADDSGSVSFDRTLLTLSRIAALKWMRDKGVPLVDGRTHGAAIEQAQTEYDARYERYIEDVIAHNERAG